MPRLKNTFDMRKLFFPALGALMLSLAIGSCGNNSSNASTATDSTAVATAAEGATTLSIDSTSYLNWKGYKPAGEHFGKIFAQEGSISVQNGRLLAGSVLINMSSIKVEDLEGEMAQKLKGHLESEDFFEVSKYPTAKFELTDIPQEGLDLNNLKELKGNLTLKDVTKNLSIPVASVTHDEATGVYTIKSDKFVIDRSQWNVKYGSKSFFTGLGDKFIENNIELSFELQAK